MKTDVRKRDNQKQEVRLSFKTQLQNDLIAKYYN